MQISLHWIKLYPRQVAPGSTVVTFFNAVGCFGDGGRFVHAFHESIPLGEETVIELGHYRQVAGVESIVSAGIAHNPGDGTVTVDAFLPANT